MSEIQIEFITRAGCGLCEDQRPKVERLVERFGGTFVLVDVDSDPDLRTSFSDRVPVVRGPNGAILAEGRIGMRGLRRRLKTKTLL